METTSQQPPPSLMIAEPLRENPLDEILTIEEQEGLSENIRQKLRESIHELKKNIHLVQTQFQHEKVAYGQHTYDLDSQVRNSLSKLEGLRQELDNEKVSRNEREKQCEDIKLENTGLKTQLEELSSQLTTSTAKVTQLESTTAELSQLLEKRNTEISKLSADIGQLTSQLESTTVAKINAMTKVDELTSREIEITYKEKQLTRETLYQADQLKHLDEELERKSLDLLSAQRESSIKYLHLQTDLTEKIEQLKIAELNLASLKEVKEKQEQHVESLMTKLQQQNELERKMEENYRVEVASLKRVGELYKESSEESSKKLEELEDGVSSLQELLKEATEKYGSLENRFSESSRNFQEEISKRDEEILKLKSELKTANEVLEGIQKHGMTDDMITSLSPAAAAASAMLKGSKSITEIFSKYQEVQLELATMKGENMKLNGYIKEIFADIENRAPVLQKQKDEYERAMQTVEILSSQMDVTMGENAKCKTEIVQLKKNVGVAERENQRLRGQISDLARQVKSLLGETTSESGGGNSGQDVINENLVCFSNIDELQRQNMKLLGVVRELTEERERGEREVQEKSLGEIRSSFQHALSELGELKEIRLRQDEKIKEIQQQRDTLNNLLKQRSDSNSNKSDNMTESKLKESERQLIALKEDFETYKIERRENERMLNESSEKLRDDLLRLRSENARLASQVEYNNERAKVYSSNLEGYKKQIKVMEERNCSLNSNCGKIEGLVVQLRNELTTSHEKLSRAEVSLTTVTNERNLLREAKSRLQMEKDMLTRHNQHTTQLEQNLEQIKNSLEMSSTALQIRLQNEIESLKQENTLLKRKIDTDTDKLKNLLSTCDSNIKDLREKIKSEQETVVRLELENEDKKNKIRNLEIEMKTLQSVEPPQLDTATEPTQQQQQPIEVATLKSELESIKNQLSLVKDSCDEYKNLSVVLEEQLSMTNETNKAVGEELSDKIREKESENCKLKVEIANTKKEFENFKEESIEKISTANGRVNDLENQLRQKETEFSIIKKDCSKLEEELDRIKSDYESQVRICNELRTEYESEIVKRGEDATKIKNIKQELDEFQAKLEEVEKLKQKAESNLSHFKEEFEKEKLSLMNELESLKSELKEQTELSRNLENQLVQAMTSQSMEGVQIGNGGGENSEQWLQLIRFLRREKEIAIGKMEVALANMSRTEGQLELMGRRYEEVKNQLEKVDGENSTALLTSVKQHELMRKVETLSAVTDSNRLLREETNSLRTNLSQLQTRLDEIESSELNPLKLQLKSLQSTNDSLALENTCLKRECERWKSRSSALIEKTNKVNPEEIKRLQQENESLLKNTTQLSEEMKKTQLDSSKNEKHLKLLQSQVASLQSEKGGLVVETKKLETELKKVGDESVRYRAEFEKGRGEIETLRLELAGKIEDVGKLRTDVERLESSLEEHRSTVKQVKNIARKYKKQCEDLQAAAEPQQQQSSDTVAATAELQKEIEDLKNERESQEEKLGQIKILEEKLEDALQSCLEKDGQMSDLEHKTVELEEKLRESEENFEALKIQWLQRFTRMEAELTDKSTENGSLTSQLEMLRQRLNLIEKTFASSSSANKKEEQQEDKLTASIRPMAAVKEQKLIVVTPQNVVQPMVQIGSGGASAQNIVSSSAGEFSGYSSRVVQIQPQVHQDSSSVIVEGSDEQPPIISTAQLNPPQQRPLTPTIPVLAQPPTPTEVEVEVEDDEHDRELPLDETYETVSSSENNPLHQHHEQASSSTNNKRQRECSSSGQESSSSGSKRLRGNDDVICLDESDEDEEVEQEESNDEEDGREAESADMATVEDEEEEDEENEQELAEEDEDEVGEESEEDLRPPNNPISSSSSAADHRNLDHTLTTTTEEDVGLVPSTPTLFVPRRSDGFSEMTMNRFTFNRGEMTIEDNENTGRSVPSTPAPSSGQMEEQEEANSDDQTHQQQQHPLQTNQSSEVPSSTSTQDSQQQIQSQQQRARPTPIVWDQPTSTNQPASLISSQPRGTLGFPRPPRVRGGLGRATTSNVSSTFNRQIINPLRGVNNRMQSARRSRPGYFQGPAGTGRGSPSGGGSGAGQI